MTSAETPASSVAAPTAAEAKRRGMADDPEQSAFDRAHEGQLPETDYDDIWNVAGKADRPKPRPRKFPEGMLRAYELVSSDGTDVVGVSVWDSIESRDRYRLSEVESERRRAMAPYVVEEVSGFYVGRELKIPRD